MDGRRRGRRGPKDTRGLRDTRRVPIAEKTLDAIDSLFPDGDWKVAMDDPEWMRQQLATLRHLAGDDLEVSMIGPGGFSGDFHGIDGFESAWRDWLTPFASYRVELEENYLKGDDVVVFFAKQVGTPEGASHQIENDGASVFFVRDGKISRIEFHLERGSALRSSGLG